MPERFAHGFHVVSCCTKVQCIYGRLTAMRTLILAVAAAGAALTFGAVASAHADAIPCTNVIGQPPCDAPPAGSSVPPPDTISPPTTAGCHNTVGEFPCDAPPTTAEQAPPVTDTPPTTTGCHNTVGQPVCDGATVNVAARRAITPSRVDQQPPRTRSAPAPMDVVVTLPY